MSVPTILSSLAKLLPSSSGDPKAKGTGKSADPPSTPDKKETEEKLKEITASNPHHIKCKWRYKPWPESNANENEAFVRATGYKIDCDESDLENVQKIISLRDEGITDPKLVSALGYYFINPKKFPRPKGKTFIPGDPKLAEIYKKVINLYALRIDSKDVPSWSRRLWLNIKPASFKTERRKSKAAALTCVGRHRGRDKKIYGLFVTARHLFSEKGSGHLKIGKHYSSLSKKLQDPKGIYVKENLHVAGDIHLLAIPLKRNKLKAWQLEIAGGKRKGKRLFTVGSNRKVGIATSPRYSRTLNGDWAYRKAKKKGRKSDHLLVRALSQTGDSGSPILNEYGEIVAIVTNGDKHFTTAAYHDMKTLRRRIKELRKLLD